MHGACVLCNGPETPSYWLRATLVGDILFVTCGWDDVTDDFTSILSWNPVAESWLPAGDLAVERFSHAAVPKLRSYVVATLRDWSNVHLDRVPAWLWEVRRGNKPPKKWYFNFQGQFLSPKKFYIKKLNGIGFSHVRASNSAILKQFEKFHKVTAALWLPSSSFATFLEAYRRVGFLHFC